MAKIICAECGEETDNVYGGIFIVEEISTGERKGVCGNCKEKLIGSGGWKEVAQARSFPSTQGRPPCLNVPPLTDEDF